MGLLFGLLFPLLLPVGQIGQGFPAPRAEAEEVVIAPFDDMTAQLIACEKVTEFAPIALRRGAGKAGDLRRLFVGCVAHGVPVGSYRVSVMTKLKVARGTCNVFVGRPVCTLVAKVYPEVLDTLQGGFAEFHLEGATGLAAPVWLIVNPVLELDVDEAFSSLSSYGRTVAFDGTGWARVPLSLVGIDYVVTLVSAGRAVGSAVVLSEAGRTEYRLSYVDRRLEISRASPDGQPGR